MPSSSLEAAGVEAIYLGRQDGSERCVQPFAEAGKERRL